MNDLLVLDIEPEARADIRAELGSMNAFYSRLQVIIAGEVGKQASLSEGTSSETGHSDARGGEVVEVISAISGIIAALSPIVIAWIRSRGFTVDETVRTQKNGSAVHRLRVHKGSNR